MEHLDALPKNLIKAAIVAILLTECIPTREEIMKNIIRHQREIFLIFLISKGEFLALHKSTYFVRPYEIFPKIIGMFENSNGNRMFVVEHAIDA
jgi:hypothetical protein